MADDKSQTGAPDRSRINTSEEYELNYWTGELGVTREALIAAVRKVGPMVEDVRRELGK
jgi:hypothetical protein